MRSLSEWVGVALVAVVCVTVGQSQNYDPVRTARERLEKQKAAATNDAPTQESGAVDPIAAAKKQFVVDEATADNATFPVVEVEQLKTLLPAQLGFLKQKAVQGQKQDIASIRITVASAMYEGAKNAMAHLTISDHGGGPMQLDLHEKTIGLMRQGDSATPIQIKGFEAVLSDNGGRSTTVCIKAGRFAVVLHGFRMSQQATRTLAESLDLKSIAETKPR